MLTGLFLNLHLDCVRFCGFVVRACGGPPTVVRTTEEPPNTSVRCGSEKARILKGSVAA